MDAGAHDNVSRLACSVHTGTHVDAPHHFLNDHRTVESLALDILVGPALVVQIPAGCQAGYRRCAGKSRLSRRDRALVIENHQLPIMGTR